MAIGDSPINLFRRGHDLSQDSIDSYPISADQIVASHMLSDGTYEFYLYPYMPLDRLRPCLSKPML